MPRLDFIRENTFLVQSSIVNACEVAVIRKIRPVGKNMSNQAAVHKAFFLVLDGLKTRYCSEGRGLMASLLNIVNSLPAESRVCSCTRW